MLASAAAGVLLLGCFGRGDGAPECCADPEDTDCIRVTNTGLPACPRTIQLPGSAFAFDAPAGVAVAVFRIDTRDYTTHPASLPPTTSPAYRHHMEFSVVYTKIVHGRGTLFINPRTGKEIGRQIAIDPSGSFVVLQYPTGRFVVDWWTGSTIADFPLDRVSILPDVAVLFARTSEELVFDEIVASIRTAQ